MVKARVDESLSEMLLIRLPELEDLEGFLSGEGNFRKAIAVTAPYKGNRSGAKPEHYDFIRDYLKSGWCFTESVNEEADDCIAKMATSLGDEAIIVSIDKDFDQVPGWHYNPVKKRKYYVTPSEGIRNFYKQILTGDRADNVIGLYRVGEKAASKLLEGCSTEQEMFLKCLDAYDDNVERVIENGKLLWLRRFDNEVWTPPIGITSLVRGNHETTIR